MAAKVLLLGIQYNAIKKMKHFKKVFILTITIFSFLFSIVSAVTLESPFGTTDVQVIINKMINALLGIVGTIAVLMIVYGGIKIMISGGEPTKYEEAKKTITYAVVGLVVVLLAGAFINFILGVFR